MVAFKLLFSTLKTIFSDVSQWFLMGLQAPIRQQLLLQERPATMDKAVRGDVEVEYALQFGQETREVHAVQPTVKDKCLEQLSQTMEWMALQLEKLEGQLMEDRYKLSNTSSNSTQKQATYRGARARHHNLCFLCGQEGHSSWHKKH